MSLNTQHTAVFSLRPRDRLNILHQIKVSTRHRWLAESLTAPLPGCEAQPRHASSSVQLCRILYTAGGGACTRISDLHAECSSSSTIDMDKWDKRCWRFYHGAAKIIKPNCSECVDYIRKITNIQKERKKKKNLKLTNNRGGVTSTL